MSRLHSNNNPRGSLLKPPARVEVQAVRGHRWTLLLAGAAGGLLLALIVFAVLLLNNSGQDRAAAGPTPKPPPSPAPAPKEVRPPVAPAKDPRPAATPAATTPANRKDQMLEAVGGLSAANLYQNFLNIGLLADGVESETYTHAEALKMLNTVAGLMELVDTHLQRLTEVGLEAQDLKSVEKIRRLTELLRKQATALRSYWETGNQEQVTRYHAAREEAWAGLSELLGAAEKQLP